MINPIDIDAEQLAALDKEALIEIILQFQRNKSSEQTKTEFMSIITHELRMPMNAILTPARALYSGIITDPETRHQLLSFVVEGGERMLKLIDEILTLSSLDAGQTRLTVSAEYTHQMLEDVAAPYRVIANEKHIELNLSISPTVPEIIVCDAKKVRSIISNLIANAIKFTEKGSVTVKIDSNGTNWTIAVSDTGIGMPTNAVDYIFERFRQVENDWSRQYGGTGIGLALVKEYVTLMYGTIDVQTLLGSGSIFTITLPLRNDKLNNGASSD